MATPSYKSRKQYTMTVDIKLFDTLNKLSKETRIPKSKLVDEALELLFEKHNIEIKKGESIQEAIDRLTEEMLSFAKNYEFEKAANIRDFINDLKDMR